jgi:hypothetical protein
MGQTRSISTQNAEATGGINVSATDTGAGTEVTVIAGQN